MDLGTQDLESFQALIAGSLESHKLVDDVHPPHAPGPGPGRSPGVRPGSEENPYGAWFVTTSIIDPEATGPLRGKRVAVKDNTQVAGVQMMNGSASFAGHVADADATVVTRLLQAGAHITGKSVCEDLCFSGGSHTAATGPVHNPWKFDHSAGGSSSGSAVLVALGEVDMAEGGDQGGSIRIPAAWCGVVGLKPTHGLVPYTGAFPIETTLDHLGPIARTVEDTALMLSVIAGPDGLDPRQVRRDGTHGEVKAVETSDYLEEIAKGADGLRVGVVTEGFGWPNLSDPAADTAVRDRIEALRSAGMHVEEVSIPEHLMGIHIWNVIAIEGAANQMVTLRGYGMNHRGPYSLGLMDAFHSGIKARINDVSETVKLTTLMGMYLIEQYGGTYYAKGQNLVPWLKAAYDRALQSYDLLMMPTVPMPATVIPAADCPREEYVARALEMLNNTAPFDVTGHPAITVPAGLVGGLPASMMLVGRSFDDATVLRGAAAYESAVGGFPAPV
jgi:amidase